MEYPKVDLAIAYAVDPGWPQRPANMPWGHMPGVAIDRQERVVLFTRSEAPVQIYEADGRFVRAWGQGLFGKAHHITIDPEGNLWLADIGRHVVEKYTLEGKRLLTLGTPGVPGCDETHMNMPTDMAVTPAGDVYVSDGYGNARVVRFDRTGRFVRAWGELGTRPGQFNLPHSIAVDSRGRVYVASRNNAQMQVFDPEGRLLAEWRHLFVPWGHVITPGDELWLVGSTPMRWEMHKGEMGGPPKDQVFMKFDTEGRLLQLWAVPKGADGKEKPGELNWVHGIAVDPKGNLYVGDIEGRRAQKFMRLPAAR